MKEFIEHIDTGGQDLREENHDAPLAVVRRPERFAPEHRRVITKLFLPGGAERIVHTVNRVLSLSEGDVRSKLNEIFREFEHRHRRFRRSLFQNYKAISSYVSDTEELTEARKLLLGACFTHEYSVSAAAMFNPSIVPHPDQEGVREGSIRFIISFRATGEGHISSVEFRSGVIDDECDIDFDPISPYLEIPEINVDATYEKRLFALKLREIEADNEVTQAVLSYLPAQFTMDGLRHAIEEVEHDPNAPHDQMKGIATMLWLAESNYTVLFPSEHSISERVLFPIADSESRGIEDVRLVRFVDDDGDVTYYATYTAYDGFHILPQLIETKDFVTFKIATLNGRAVQNKGMALFPRKINGRYVMLGRQDGENNYIMFSDNVHFWQEKHLLDEPEYTWEFVQIGNNGSPLETEKGWLVITHGVGPMRKYCLGCLLLDLDDPRKVIARLPYPLLSPNTEERDGYVPNVVYTCGVMIHGGQIVLPYAMSDSISGFATIGLNDLLDRMVKTNE